ncbi:MAG: hypothetical protein HZB92_05115 [Euryarchaeota archaeon]|nr:hypothetical protein [Euryarchaeota archaeon]
MKSFEKDEIKKLIGNRLSIYSKNVNDVIDDSAITLLNAMSEGNPRRALSLMENFCKNASILKEPKITKEFIEKVYGENVWITRREIILKLANSSKYYSEGLSRIYLFYDKMERANLNIDDGFQYLRLSYDKAILIDDIDPEYINSLSTVLYRYSDKSFNVSYVIQNSVRDFFKELKKQNIDFDDFIVIYKEQQLTPTQLDKTLSEIIKKPNLVNDVKEYFNRGNEIFQSLTVQRDKNPPQKILLESWDCLENIIKALLIHNKILRVDEVLQTTKVDKFGIVKMTPDEKIQEGIYYFTQFRKLPKIVGYITSLTEINHVLRKRNQLLRTPPRHFSQFSEKDAQASFFSLKRAYYELIELFNL